MQGTPESPFRQAAAQRLRALERSLLLASAELGLTRDALERHLPARVKNGDVAWALAQAAEVERMVEAAVHELQALAALVEEPCGN